MPGAIILILLILLRFDAALAEAITEVESGATKDYIALKQIENSNESNFPTHFKQGHYEIAPRIIKSVIDAGDVVEGEMYIVGFGMIESVKVNVRFSTDIFKIEESTCQAGVSHWMLSGDSSSFDMRFGSQPQKITNAGIVFSLTTAGVFKKLFPMYPVNPHKNDLAIFTETWRESSPVHLSLKTKKDTPSGNYHLDFFLTYFNGTNWQGSKYRAEFKVRNIFERNEDYIRFVVILASSYTALGFIRLLFLGFRYIRNRNTKPSSPPHEAADLNTVRGPVAVKTPKEPPTSI